MSKILVIIFWYFLIMQLTSELPQVKRYLISTITNLAHELPHELPKTQDLTSPRHFRRWGGGLCPHKKKKRLRILENQEVLEKCQMWVQTQPNVQSSFQRLNADNSCQQTRKIRYIFETLSNFIVSLYFLPIILSRIVDKNLKTYC